MSTADVDTDPIKTLFAERARRAEQERAAKLEAKGVDNDDDDDEAEKEAKAAATRTTTTSDTDGMADRKRLAAEARARALKALTSRASPSSHGGDAYAVSETCTTTHVTRRTCTICHEDDAVAYPCDANGQSCAQRSAGAGATVLSEANHWYCTDCLWKFMYSRQGGPFCVVCKSVFTHFQVLKPGRSPYKEAVPEELLQSRCVQCLAVDSPESNPLVECECDKCNALQGAERVRVPAIHVACFPAWKGLVPRCSCYYEHPEREAVDSHVPAKCRGVRHRTFFEQTGDLVVVDDGSQSVAESAVCDSDSGRVVAGVENEEGESEEEEEEEEEEEGEDEDDVDVKPHKQARHSKRRIEDTEEDEEEENEGKEIGPQALSMRKWICAGFIELGRHIRSCQAIKVDPRKTLRHPQLNVKLRVGPTNTEHMYDIELAMFNLSHHVLHRGRGKKELEIIVRDINNNTIARLSRKKI